MKPNPTSALALPKTKLAPPPKKSEIIEALALRELELQIKARDEWQAKSERLTAEYKEAALIALKADIDAGAIGSFGTQREGGWEGSPRKHYVSLNFSLDRDTVPALKRLGAEIDKHDKAPRQVGVECHQGPHPLRDVRCASTPTDRIKAMLSDPATLKSLKTLTAMKQPAQPALAA